MPSPPPAIPTTQQNGNTTSASVQNGNIEQKETVSPFNGPSKTNGAPSDTTTDSTIEQGKQRAKAFMAASGLPITASVDGGSTTQSVASSSRSEGQLPGPQPGRKRSRSGTRMPQPSQPAPQKLVHRTEEIRDKAILERYAHQDLLYTSALLTNEVAQAEHMDYKRETLLAHWRKLPQRRADPGAFFGRGYAGYGNGRTDNGSIGLKVIYPHERKRPGGRRTKELHVSKKDRATQADQLDELVPIRLDIEWQKIRLRDTFTWNVHDRVVPLELFAEQLVEDFNVPPEQWGPVTKEVFRNLDEQIRDFHPHAYIDEDALDPHLPYSAYKNDEMRILIKLNITIGQHTLVDQFEWEINNPLNSPEDFARQMALDLSLSGEFTTAIAHSIREQSQLFTRSLYVTGHPFDGRPIEDQELSSAFLPSPLTSTFRPFQAAKDFTPYLYELNEAELEKTELSLSREERRQKRSVNRRGGPALPDLKDRRRTIRTLIVSSILPGAAETLEESRLFKRTATASGKGRRTGGGQRDGIDDSEDSESEDSSPDSPAVPPHLLAGTARTRGMRGAASAAQAAMRANLGRSATPESSLLHHHETRTSGRKGFGREYREDSSVDMPTSLVVKLRVPRQKFQQLLRDLRARNKEESLQPQAQTSRPPNQRSLSTTPLRGAIAPGSMGPPATTPRMQPQSLPEPSNGAPPQQQAATVDASQLGRVAASGPPGPEHPIVSTLNLLCE